MRIRINITSVLVDDQAKALAFYTDKLGFELKHDVPAGEARWLTLTSPGDHDGVELLLEPDANFGAPEFKSTLKSAGVPYTQFQVDDVQEAFDELREKGVEFTMEPTNAGPVSIVVLDDTCGNLVQLISEN